jgi:UDP-glucose 4-epimerase
MPVVIVRPFNTYGPREPWKGTRAEVIPRFILCMLNGRSPVIFGDGNQTRDFTFVEDTVRGIVAAASCDALVGRAVNVAAGKERSIAEMAEVLREELGSSVQPCFGAPRPGDVLRHVADVSLAAKCLGFEAKTDLRDGLRRTIDWLRFHANQESAVRMAASANW